MMISAVPPGAVCRHHAGAAAVREDRKALALKAVARGENPRSGEELRVGLDADRAGPAQRGVEHRIGANQRAGVARDGSCQDSPIKERMRCSSRCGYC